MFGFNDPFFDNHFNSMMSGFMMDPFGSSNRQRGGGNGASNGSRASRNSYDPFALTAFDDRRAGSNNSLIAAHQSSMRDPFALMNQMMGGGGFGSGIFNNFDHLMNGNNPNAQVYSSSSVISYSNTGDGKPKVYQASSHTRQAGGVKETRKMVRDSEKGFEKVAIGHHIGEKAHIIERQKVKDGPIEEVVNLENLDDDELDSFNQEFERKIQHPQAYSNAYRNSNVLPIGGYSSTNGGNNHRQYAIEDSGRSHKNREHKSKSKTRH